MPKHAITYRTRKKRKTNRDLWLYLLILILCSGIVWTLAYKGGPAGLRKKPKPSAKFDLDQLTAALEHKFDLPQGGISNKEDAGCIEIAIPVSQAKMDLTFANFIVKDEFESRGATLRSGKVENGTQVLTFSLDSANYRVTLSPASLAAGKDGAGKSLAIVVDDFGLVEGEMLDEWLSLPLQVDFAIISGLKHSEETMTRAHAQGRETLVHVPMEPIGYPSVDPGENPILVQMEQAQVEKTLIRHLNALPLCAGVNNHMGSLATADHKIMQWVMGVLKTKDKFFLDSRTSNVSIAYQTAREARIPAYLNDLFLDAPDISDVTLESRLKQVQELGRQKDAVIVITHCHSAAKLEYLKNFIRRIQSAGFNLVPLTQVGRANVPLIM